LKTVPIYILQEERVCRKDWTFPNSRLAACAALHKNPPRMPENDTTKTSLEDTNTAGDLAPAAVPIASDRFPPQTKFILGNETCERFSFYGMKSILTGYALVLALTTGALSFDQAEQLADLAKTPDLLTAVQKELIRQAEDRSTIIVHAFVFACYFTPLLGGWIADRFWGRYKTILWISLLYCAGHGVLALSELSPSVTYKTTCLYAGLALIALGSGGIKPCVSAFMGDQFNPGQSRLIARAYAAFYWCINLGSLGAFLLIPWVRLKYGYAWAFGIPGILMAAATLVFWLGRKRYVFAEQTAVKPNAGLLKIVFFALFKRGADRQPEDTFWSAARRRFGVESVADVVAACRVLWIFLFVPPFWALFDQSASTWVLQGKKMIPITSDYVPIFGGEWRIFFSHEQMQAANPAFIMMLVPIITLLVYPWLGKIAAPPLRRMAAGMVCAAASFVLAGWLQSQMESGQQLSLLWQLLPYLVLTTGEVLVSITGLEFAYTQAPKSMKSYIGSFWLLTVAAGQLIVMAITHFGGGEGGDSAVSSGRFFLYAGLMAATAVLFAVATAFYKYRQTAER
jgi:POT family proton-dependent oligopeptide transporter